MSLINISTSSGSTTGQALGVTFYGTSTQNYVSTTQFTDNTYLSWDVTMPISTSIWSGFFGDTASALPSKYLNVPIMTNQASYVWAWPSQTSTTPNTITMPTGVLTLGTIMNTLYAATATVISASQYQDITGVPPSGSVVLTVGKALRDNSSNIGGGGTVNYNGLSFETSKIIRIN